MSTPKQENRGQKFVIECHDINKARVTAALASRLGIQNTSDSAKTMRRVGNASKTSLRSNRTQTQLYKESNPMFNAYGSHAEQEHLGRYDMIRNALSKSTHQPGDCADNTPTATFKTMMNLKTKCPLTTQDNVIEAIKYRGSKGQIQ